MNNLFLQRIGMARIVALGLLAFALLIRVIDPIPLQFARNLTFDLFQRIEPREPQELPVAIIDVDDASLAEFGQWPWPRTRYAELVEKMMQDGAVAIAFDIIFAEPDRLSPDLIAEDNPRLPSSVAEAMSVLPNNDQLLASAFSKGPVVVGQTSLRSSISAINESSNVPQVPHAIIGPDPEAFIMTLPDLVQNIPVLEAAAAGRGLFSARPDPDGVYRRLPLVANVHGQLRLGLAAELLRIAAGGEPFLLRANEAGVDGVVIARTFFQTAGDGTVQPYLTRSQPSRFVSAADILAGRTEPGRLKGRLVMVGTSAIGLGDYRATPFGVQMPGVEVHAQLLENLLTGSLLQRPNYTVTVELLAAALVGLLFIILVPVMNAVILATSALFFLTALGLGAFSLFLREQLLIDPSFPILTGLATVIFMATTNYMREEQRRREVRNAFRHYVSADLVNALTDNRQKLQLGGETRELTLLFSDVRGFTSIAESFRDHPEGLTLLMNRFLTLLSKAILDEKGTIDKFMGDAVMAFWNAPLDHTDHVRAGCRAALAMKRRVAALNTVRHEEESNAPPINIGIGISTGSCLVGNMGSDTRFDYTAMGDPVNLASRLEGQSKTYGTTIIVGSATEAQARDDFAFLELDLIRVKGKSFPERVFALLGGAELRNAMTFSKLSNANTRMLAAYRGGDWATAAELLPILDQLSQDLELDLATYFGIYQSRLAKVSGGPAPEGWDGVYDATSK